MLFRTRNLSAADVSVLLKLFSRHSVFRLFNRVVIEARAGLITKVVSGPLAHRRVSRTVGIMRTEILLSSRGEDGSAGWCRHLSER